MRKSPYEKIKEKFPHLELLEYTGSKSDCKVKDIRCGHEWIAVWGSIIGNKGGFTCRVCTPRQPVVTSKKRTLEEVNLILQEKYPNIYLTEYNGSNELATVASKTCNHTWRNIPRNILSGHSGYLCRVCNPAKNSVMTLEAANDRLKNICKDLSFIEYNGYQKYSVVKSNKCEHTWTLMLNNIETGNSPHSCPVCFPRLDKTSRGEESLKQYIKSIYNGWIIYNDRLNISPYELDILIPDKGIAIEYNGEYWHSEGIGKVELVTKTDMLPEDIQLLHIFEHEWENKQDIVKSIIKHKIVGSDIKINARDCEIKQIDFPRQFLDENHIQGSGAATSINLGLYYKDDLVMVMTFSKPRFNTEVDYELVRLCSKINTYIIGGASKLFKYFCNNYKFESILSYADRRFSNGKVYDILKFKLSHVSKPNYFYYKNGNILSRYSCQKHKLKDLFPTIYKEELTELEIMKLAGYVKINDCGSLVYIFK